MAYNDDAREPSSVTGQALAVGAGALAVAGAGSLVGWQVGKKVNEGVDWVTGGRAKEFAASGKDGMKEEMGGVSELAKERFNDSKIKKKADELGITSKYEKAKDKFTSKFGKGKEGEEVPGAGGKPDPNAKPGPNGKSDPNAKPESIVTPLGGAEDLEPTKDSKFSKLKEKFDSLLLDKDYIEELDDPNSSFKNDLIEKEKKKIADEAAKKKAEEEVAKKLENIDPKSLPAEIVNDATPDMPKTAPGITEDVDPTSLPAEIVNDSKPDIPKVDTETIDKGKPETISAEDLKENKPDIPKTDTEAIEKATKKLEDLTPDERIDHMEEMRRQVIEAREDKSINKDLRKAKRDDKKIDKWSKKEEKKINKEFDKSYKKEVKAHDKLGSKKGMDEEWNVKAKDLKQNSDNARSKRLGESRDQFKKMKTSSEEMANIQADLDLKKGLKKVKSGEYKHLDEQGFVDFIESKRKFGADARASKINKINERKTKILDSKPVQSIKNAPTNFVESLGRTGEHITTTGGALNNLMPSKVEKGAIKNAVSKLNPIKAIKSFKK